MTEERRENAASAGPGMTPTPTPEALPGDPVEVRTEPTPAPDGRSLDDLAGHIVELAGRPIDLWAVSALLESIGIRDRDAVETYGFDDVFGLAVAVQARLPELTRDPADVAEPRPPRRQRVARYVRIYGRGTFFFVPLSLQLIALLTIGVSQFASVDFTARDASLVAVAAALSFLVTAGFTQALGYLGPIFIETGKHMLAESVAWTVMGLGALAALVVGVLAWIIASATGGYSTDDLRIAAAYYALLSAQGLCSALLYMLRRFGSMILATIFSLAVAGVLVERTTLEVQQIHWISLGVAVALQLGVGWVVLLKRARNTKGDMRLAKLPPARLLFDRTFPFAVYGIIYFTFLSADRAVAWTAGENPLPLWFHPEYEIGLDWALGGIVFALAFLEVTVEDFSRMLVPAAEGFRIDAVREHNRSIRRFWAKQLSYVGILAAVGTWASVLGAVALHEGGLLGRADEIYEDPITRYVFGFGLLGYVLLTLGIANSVFVMSLNRPWRAVAAIGPGVAVSFAVGIVATTHYAHWTAVFGMVAGAGVFALISAWQAWRTLRHADYYSYAAY